ncbi:MDR/zinc-dependent alcohol dehydrogenase-like family protein [Salinisphaera sp.]|uniref:MDR/zinc-dependent alcohol dehydrogenase-like family protein n=1 Tax=Salinisphaera sp. TaxID=1914330 RepID=UPI002D77E13C|nr:zinc-binding dehydrogenase [Salinisphaera sp.]HET7315750.1 zinc-binding dehydrogenase [Salinisphaera sp.]
MSAGTDNGARQDMRAAILTSPGCFEIRHVPVPRPAAGQVRIRVEGCGVCASTLPAFEGRDWFDYPLAPGGLGHEVWGVVDACGAEVSGVEPGQRVAALSSHGFAEYDLAAGDAVIELPDTLAARAFPGEALGCVMNIWRRADIRAGHTVAVVGAGFLGAALIRLAVDAGAEVIAVSRSAWSREQAAAMGAREILPLDDGGAVQRRIEQLTGGAGCERVIEATGKPEPLNVAGALTAFGGRLVIAGFHQDGPRTVDMQMWNWRGIDVINAHERDPAVALDGVRRAIEAVDRGKLDLARLVTHDYPLHELGEAMRAVQQRSQGLTKAVITMGESDHA